MKKFFKDENALLQAADELLADGYRKGDGGWYLSPNGEDVQLVLLQSPDITAVEGWYKEGSYLLHLIGRGGHYDLCINVQKGVAVWTPEDERGRELWRVERELTADEVIQLLPIWQQLTAAEVAENKRQQQAQAALVEDIDADECDPSDRYYG